MKAFFTAQSLLLAIGLLPLATSTDQTTSPIVNLGYARYQGILDRTSNTTQFLGLRYAAPPTGLLRWQAPQPPLFIEGIQQASKSHDPCLQTLSGLSPTNPYLRNEAGIPAPRNTFSFPNNGTEDCLVVDVYVPGKLNPNANLPVLVWTHGGAYAFGGAEFYPGSDLVQRSNGNLIIVVLQYRLGLFGFLAGTKVKEGGALNAGLLDQQLALKWIQNHITSFGGDPSRVTIWGQSAGGASSLQHVVANDGQTDPPLFRYAMSSSTYAVSQYAYNARIPELIYSKVVEQAKCSDSNDTLACLRSKDVSTLEEINYNVSASGFFAQGIFVPVIDGEFITQPPLQALKQGKVNGHAVLTTHTSFEGLQFVNTTAVALEPIERFIERSFPELEEKNVELAAKLYENIGDAGAQAVAIVGEAILICPSYRFLQAFPGRSYKSEFAIPPAPHSADLPYDFPHITAIVPPPYNTAPFPPVVNDTDFQIAFPRQYVNFAISADPNMKVADDITPPWPVWDEEQRLEVVFNVTADSLANVTVGKVNSELLNRCRFWESVGPQIGQ